MSSPLYAVRVREVGGGVVRLDVHSACEAGCFAVSPLFAVGLLFEALQEQVYARPGVRWPRRIDGPLRACFREQELMDWAGGGMPDEARARLAIAQDVAWEDFRNLPSLPASTEPDGRYRVRPAGSRFRSEASPHLEPAGRGIPTTTTTNPDQGPSPGAGAIDLP